MSTPKKKPTAAEQRMLSPSASWRGKERYVIEVTLGNDNEPRDIFLGGMEEGDMRITRGKAVIVPPSVLTRLDDAIQGVPQPDDEDSDKVVVVDRLRFPYSVLQVVPAGAPDPDMKHWNLQRRELPGIRRREAEERQVDPDEVAA